MRSWQSHSNVNAHQIPDFKGRRRPPTLGGRRRRAPCAALFRVGHHRQTASRCAAARRREARGITTRLAAARRPCRGRRRRPDGVAQLELYTALFGEAPTGEPTPAPSTTEEQHLYADSALLPNLEQAKQIERAVRKAMRGAAVERRRRR